MAATNAVSGLTTVKRSFQFGGMASKKAKRFIVTFTDASNGVTVGGTTNQILAADLGFKVIEACGNLVVFTTATGAVVAIVPAAPSPDGSYVALADAKSTTAANQENPADLAIVSTQSAQIWVDGY